MTIKHLFPPAFPKLDLNFAAERTLDPRITFTRSSVGTYMDATGILRYAAEDEPRFDHSGTGKSLGLLIEEFRTNDTYPSTFDGTTGTWRYTNYVTPNQTTAPDGTNTGALLDFEMVGAAGNLNFDSNTPQVSGTRSFSFWCKTALPGAGTQMKLELVNWTFSNGDASTNRTYTLDFDTGSPISKTDDYEVQAYPNGWYRCMISNVSQGGYLSFRINKNPQNWYIWGMQSEEGTFPTSYIPTTGATEDRDPDNCTIEGDNFLDFFNFGDHTTVAEWNRDSLNSRGYLYRYMGNQNQTAEFLEQLDINSNSLVNANTWYGNGSFSGVPSFVGSGKAAFAVTGGDSSMAVNGILQLRRDRAASSGPTTRMTIGASLRDTYLNGHIARLAYYSRRLSDEQLQALTA